MKELTIEITNSCSNKCSHCSTNASLDGKIFVPRGRFIDLLDQFPDFEKIRLSGGEPFEHPDISYFVREAKDRDKTVQILSSGIRYGSPISIPILGDVKRADLISYSLYGSREIHDKVCGVEGAFKILDDSVINTLSNKIPLSFNYVAMRNSLEGLEDAIKYISSIKLKENYCDPPLGILRFIKQGRAKGGRELALNGQELKGLLKKAEDLSKQYCVRIGSGCSLSERCLATEKRMAVTAYGEIIPCSALKYGHKSSERKFPCRDRW